MVSAVEPRLCVRRRVVLRAGRRVASEVCALRRSSHCSPAGGVTSLSRHREVTKRRRPTVLATPFDYQHLGRLPSRTARLAGAAKLRLSPRLENVGQSSPFIREPDEPLSKTKGIGVPTACLTRSASSKEYQPRRRCRTQPGSTNQRNNRMRLESERHAVIDFSPTGEASPARRGGTGRGRRGLGSAGPREQGDTKCRGPLLSGQSTDLDIRFCLTVTGTRRTPVLSERSERCSCS
jgi:hypothetical protein